MRLTNNMRERILTNVKHLNDDAYGMTTKEMEDNADMYMKAEVSLDSEIEEQTRMLEEYPDYCTPSDMVKVWLSENENDWKYLKIERTFAQKHSDSWSMRYPEFRFSRFSEHVKKNKKDVVTRRSLLRLVGKRRQILDYLQKVDIERYRNIVKELGLRR